LPFLPRAPPPPLDPPSVAASGSPNQVAVSVDGQSGYVTTGDGIDQYDLLPDGTISPKDPATVPSASGAAGIAVAPGNAAVYVTSGFGPRSSSTTWAAGRRSRRCPSRR
jgi:DNA-binding beta-propeller fold protein YncE